MVPLERRHTYVRPSASSIGLLVCIVSLEAGQHRYGRSKCFPGQLTLSRNRPVRSVQRTCTTIQQVGLGIWNETSVKEEEGMKQHGLRVGLLSDTLACGRPVAIQWSSGGGVSTNLTRAIRTPGVTEPSNGRSVIGEQFGAHREMEKSTRSWADLVVGDTMGCGCSAQ